MTIEDAIEKAQSSGYKIEPTFLDGINGDWKLNSGELFLDPLFWQSLHKAMKVGNGGKCIVGYEWKDYWHSFIDDLASGGTVETFFEKLQ